MVRKNNPKVIWHSQARTQLVIDDLVAGLPAKEIAYRHGVSYTYISKCKLKYTTTVVHRNDIPIERRLPDEPELPLNLFGD